MEPLRFYNFLTILVSSFALLWTATVAAAAEESVQKINSGDRVHLLCQYDGPIEACAFEIPGEELAIELLPDKTTATSRHARFKYFGKGLAEGECGVTIENVTVEGLATCILALNDTVELTEMIEVRIIDPHSSDLSLPKMKILNNSPLKVGQTLAAECAAKSYKDVHFLWLLNDSILNGTNAAMVKKKFERDKGTLFEFRSILKYDSLSIKDNGSVLKCRAVAANDSLLYIDTTLSLVVFNETNLLEPRIGEPYDISIKFFAFPRVLSSRWKVNKRTIYYGKATSEFFSKELKYLGNNQWNAFLHIANVTAENIHYNYTLQISDSEGTKYYHRRLDNSADKAPVDDESYTTQAITNNFDTTLASRHAEKFRSSSAYRRMTTRNFSNTYESSNTQSTAPAERRKKIIRKHQQQQQQSPQNTTTTVTEMTSVIATTTTTTDASTSTQASLASIFLLNDANTSETENVKYSSEFIENDNYFNNTPTASDGDNDNDEGKIELATKSYFDITTYEVINTTEGSGSGGQTRSAKLPDSFIASVFLLLILVIIITTVLLCHYRHQVSILKTEIIQMNLESYYNQSCLYPSTFNEYSSTNIQRSGGALIYDNNKRPLSESSDESANIVQTYSTNSHLYQSIDEIDTHVYDEIINSMERNSDSQGVGEKLSNYETNESFNNINEILIPQHCHSLMTIEEVDEYESSQSQKLSNLESTYI